jgi:AraC-like DNA-binding protein
MNEFLAKTSFFIKTGGKLPAIMGENRTVFPLENWFCIGSNQEVHSYMDGKNRIVKEILDSVEKKMESGESLSLEAMEAHTGYSRFYLNRIFSEVTGCTIHRYIMERRLTEAARKLVETDKTIVEISCEADYQSQQAFTLAFRRVYGCTPMAYRERKHFTPLREQTKQKKTGNTACRTRTDLWRCAA